MRRKVKLELVIEYELNHGTKAEELYQQVSDAADYLAIDGLLTGRLPVELKGYSVEVSRWEDESRIAPYRNAFYAFIFVVAYMVAVFVALSMFAGGC